MPLLRVVFRTLRAVVVTIAALEALYLVAMNVFLATPLFDKVINATPEDIDVHYARAWSLFPTHVTARGLSLRGTDSHVEWILRLDEVTFDCSLVELAKKRFHVTSAHGSGISFRLRMKLASPEATREAVSKLPDIDSLGPVGLIPSSPPYAGRWSDADWHLFTIHLENVVAEHVHEVWIDAGRFQGDARIAGGFYLKPIRRAEVGPATVDIRSGSASLAGRTVLEPLAAHLDFMLAGFDPRVASDIDILHGVSVSIDGRGAIPDLNDLALDLPHNGQIRGRVELPRFALRMVNGVIRDGTSLEGSAPAFLATTAAHVVSGRLSVSADVAGDRLAGLVELGDGDGDFALKVPRARLAMDAKALDLAGLLDDLHAVLDVTDAELPDARRVLDYLPKDRGGLTIGSGQARASGHLEAWRWDQRASGNVSVEAKSLDLRTPQLLFRGGANVEARVGSFRFGSQEATDVHVALGVPEATLARSADPRGPLLRVRSLHASAESARVDVAHARGNLELRARAAASVEGPGPARGMAMSVEKISMTATSPRFAAKDPLDHVNLLGTISGGHLGAPDVLRALLPDGAPTLLSENARFDGDLALQIRNHVARGAASIDARGVGITAKKAHLTGDLIVTASVDSWKLSKKELSGGVRVAVTKVAGGFAPEESAPDFVADRIDLRADATALDLAHPSMRGVDYGIRVGRADLADARALNTFLPSPNILAIESGSAVVSGDLETSNADHSAAGKIDVLLTRGGVRLHTTRLVGDFALEVQAHGFDPSRGEVDLEGSQLSMRNVAVTGASTDTTAWSGDLTLQEGKLRLTPTPRLEGDLTLQARDASPLLAVLLRDSLPKLVAELTRMPRLAASTHLAIEPNTLVVSDLFAGGGNLSLRGVYAIHDNDRRAAFVVQKGPFSAGVRLGNDGTHVHLFGLNEWFVEQRREALLGAW